MATIQFPGGASFVISEMSVTRSISRQGKGARATWRHLSLPESREVLQWNAWRRNTLDRLRERDLVPDDVRDQNPRMASRFDMTRDPWATID